MAKTFEFRRHSLKDGGKRGATLGPNGFKFGAFVGEQQLHGRQFTHYFVSALWRTHQTLVAFAYGAGDIEMRLAPEVPPLYLQSDTLHDLWRHCHAAEKRGEDMVRAAFDYDETFVKDMAQVYTELFRKWAASMPEDTNALIVGHSPHMEFIIHGLTGAIVPGLKECQGFRIHVVGENCMIERIGPQLEVNDLRTEFQTSLEGPPSRM